jgi:hypothetical protein
MRVLAVTALIAGALIRIAVLPIGAPAIDDSWRAWSYHAATRGPWNLYGPKGNTVRFGGIEAPVVYPPLALDEFAVIGLVHLALNHGTFENDAALTRTIKGAIVMLDAVLACLIFVIVRRIAGGTAGWWAAFGYWINPAVLLITSLGYVDVLVAVPAVAAVIAASSGRPWLTGVLFAAAVATKPQGLFIAPAAALALWNAGDAGLRKARLTGAVAAAAIAGACIAAPVVAAGHTYDMLRSIAVLAGHNMLSALAFNFWWIVSWMLAVADARAGGSSAALRAQTDVVTYPVAAAHGLPNPRAIALLLLAGTIAWALRTAWRAGDLALHAALAALTVVAYFTLSVQVHENHFFLALPFLAVAAALRPAFAPVFAALSVMFALNLYMIFGLHGDGPAPFATLAIGIDPSVVLSVVNCALLVWLARVFARECAHRGDAREAWARIPA